MQYMPPFSVIVSEVDFGRGRGRGGGALVASPASGGILLRSGVYRQTADLQLEYRTCGIAPSVLTVRGKNVIYISFQSP